MNSAQRKLVSAVMTRNVCQLGIDETAMQALALMRSHSVSSVLVVEQELILGIITERDIVGALQRAGSLNALGCADLMQSPVITVTAETPCLDAYHLMTSRGIRHLAVTDDEGHVRGIASEGDVMRNFGIEYYLKFKEVASVMSRHFCKLPSGSTVAAAAAQMVEKKQSCIVVVDERDHPDGMLSERDIVRICSEQAHPERLTLYEVMHAPVVTVKPRKRLHAAVKLMEDARIRRLVVVDEHGAACGLLTHHEIARGLEGDYATHLKEIVQLQAHALDQAERATDEKVLLANILRSVDGTAVLASDLDYRICYMTPSTVQVLGLDPQHLGGADIRRTLQRIGWQGAAASLDEAVVRRGARRCEAQTTCGHRHFQVSMLLDANNEPQGYLVVVHMATVEATVQAEAM